MITDRASGPGYVDVDPSDVPGERARLIDVREPSEFTGELGHIPGAELVPLATVVDAAKDWDRDANLVLVCRSGARSSRAAEALARLGFKNLKNLRGGMIAYNAAGLPTEKR